MICSNYLFVYGSLRTLLCSPHSFAFSKADCRFISHAYLTARLYQIADYPGVIASTQPDEKVYGELYYITNTNVLTILDEYEECTRHFAEPHEYVRKCLPVQLTTGKTVNAWVYVYNRDVSGLKRIISGDYLA
ncbi:gamma-glutamylcyclotransferase family protein [Methylocucumis oryzae]|uniref:Gamma-glutamylcyclotransferase AIG2-like domain-containing protein n=1 Tax=Methylocucumis oryzae TaxID=1632867 RepID=A0A0F3IEW2_9GAMM|nr:gamma-glutamylcyclotransferase family protein [Methylocucumis oryzae]KJV05291.1 hypothetical protein VZ94_19215 [Methylocucumis oryzae]